MAQLVTSQHIYIYIYIYLPESYFCTTLKVGFWKIISVPPFIENCISTAATSKMRARNCAIGELFSVPPQGCICAPQKWYSSNSPGGTVPGSLFTLCFSNIGTNSAFFWLFQKKEKHIGGTASVVQFVAFSNLGV